MSEPRDPRPVGPAPGGPPAARGWLVGPWFDLLLVANVAWPLAVLATVGESFGGQSGLQFWQLYHITTPHRWVTLPLVFADRDRFRARRGAFLAVAALVVVACLGVRVTTGALACLLAIDYVWNAWHFAAQHHGVYRVYQRLGDAPPGSGPAFEKWGMRAFLLYVILRVAGATWPDAAFHETLRLCDWFVILIPGWLIVRDLARPGGRHGGGRA